MLSKYEMGCGGDPGDKKEGAVVLTEVEVF